MASEEERKADYKQGSLSLTGAIAMGTGVMIGAGIFALTGQVAELAREWFPLAFVLAAIISSFSAYSYVKMSNAYPSAGGIAMYLSKAYGEGTVTAVAALLMYFSMVINESLVARTFGTYVIQLFDGSDHGLMVEILGIALLAFAFLVNILTNRFIETFSFFMAFVKIGGIAIFAVAGLWASGLELRAVTASSEGLTAGGFLSAVALAILAYKGFTTITNSGGEITNPHRNVGRAITLAIAICFAVYMLVSLAVGSTLTIEEIVAARDYSLAEAARPVFGDYGLWFTVGFAIVATTSGVIASVFAVSRMLAMLTEMKLVPHRHFGMPGSIQKHTMVYTIVMAMLLTLFFDLSRIASLGAIFYLLMDMAVHWGILRHIRKEIDASAAILITALALDGVVLLALLILKAQSDIVVIYSAVVGLAVIVIGERLFLRGRT